MAAAFSTRCAVFAPAASRDLDHAHRVGRVGRADDEEQLDLRRDRSSPRPAGSASRNRCRRTAATAAAGTARAARRRSASSRPPRAWSATARPPSPGRAPRRAPTLRAVDQRDVLRRLTAGADRPPHAPRGRSAGCRSRPWRTGAPRGAPWSPAGRWRRSSGDCAGRGLLVHLGRDAVRGEDHDRALGHLVVLLDEDRAALPPAPARRAGCARSACGRTPGRRSDRARARRSAPRGRRPRSSRAAWRAARSRGLLGWLDVMPASMVRTARMGQAGVMRSSRPPSVPPRSGRRRHRRGQAPARPGHRTADAGGQHSAADLPARPAALRPAGRAGRRGAQPPRDDRRAAAVGDLRRPGRTPGERRPGRDRSRGERTAGAGQVGEATAQRRAVAVRRVGDE